MGFRVALGEICSFNRGASIPRARMRNSGDLLYIHYGDLYKRFDLRIDVEKPAKPLPFISADEKIKDSQRLNDQDIVYVLTSETVDDLGHAYLFNNPSGKLAVSGTETTIVRVERKDIVLPAYLNYLMSSPRFIGELRQYTRGMKVFRVHPSDVARIEVDLPSIDEQQKVVAILDAVYEKQQINTQLNGYLEELASALYKKFVASADGRMGTLADLVELQKDGTRAGKHPELPYMPIDVMPMKHIGVTEFKANEEARSSLQLFRRDDIVIGAMRVYFHRVVLAPCEGITRNTCFVLRPRSSSLREYALLTCFQPEAIEYANVRSKGSTMPYAVWENSFETYPVLTPEEGQLDRFSRRLAPLIDQIRDSCRENNKLASLRDTLLPKLMSGEIDVSKIDLTQLNSHLA